MVLETGEKKNEFSCLEILFVGLIGELDYDIESLILTPIVEK